MDNLEKKIESVENATITLLADMVTNMNKEREQTKRGEKILPWIFCFLITIIVSVALVLVSNNVRQLQKDTLDFLSQYEFYVVEETVNQDTGTGAGNNVYLPGDNAEYKQYPKDGEVSGDTNDQEG